MILATKHQGQQSIRYSDFKGGLNTSSLESEIAETELSVCSNMEVDRVTGLLRTCKGLRKLITINTDVTDAAYDVINKLFVFFGADRHVYITSNFSSVSDVGVLTGSDNIVTASWENGLLIASGGQLQYYDGKELSTISTAPRHCRGVFIRSGRVLTMDDGDNVLYSGIGDETNWTQDSNDPSTSQFAQIGYKVGGKIIGAVNLSSDILFIKDNGMVFRLQNEYPDWKISEVGREIYCKGPLSFANVGNNVVILGTTLQNVVTTQDYGDMKPIDIGQKVIREIAAMPASTKLRYVPIWNQLWFIEGTTHALVLDCTTGAFFERTFYYPVVDILTVDDTVYLVRKNALCDFIDDFSDCDQPLHFHAKFKTATSPEHNILVRRVAMGITPYDTRVSGKNCKINVGKLSYPFPSRVTDKDECIISTPNRETAFINSSNELYGNKEQVSMNEDYLSPTDIIIFRARGVDRGTRIRTDIEGDGYSFILNFIGYDMVEV